jgi:hypothetical protein
MAQIVPLGGSVAITIADYIVAAAIFNEANNSIQNNILTINKQPYKFDTLTWGTSSTGTFSAATWDVLALSGSIGLVNQWPASSSFQDSNVQGGYIAIQGYFGRNGYTSTATANFTDSNGFFNAMSPAQTTKAVTADNSVLLFHAKIKSVILPGTYRLIFTLTDGSTSKTRIIDVVVSAYPNTLPGDGWL